MLFTCLQDGYWPLSCHSIHKTYILGKALMSSSHAELRAVSLSFSE
jgi:hypothetical protein